MWSRAILTVIMLAGCAAPGGGSRTAPIRAGPGKAPRRAAAGGGDRRELFRQAVAHGQSITFVGSAASGPALLDGVPFPRNHEGHGGFSIQALSTWITDHDTITTYRPDVVMLEIGTNNGLRHP